MIMKKRVRMIVLEPIWRPCREQTACGRISPKMTIAKVEPATAKIPCINVSRRIVVIELTRTLPKRIVQSKKLPRLRTG